ncbi:hypothetical protein [Phytopseudomonas dryadis]|uniref:hypothetical protein n=1 Tax=Pseudomonadaceae TaxID=135621 RepID=UPI00103818E1|nr:MULTISPECIES: hypothetical protein [Pseudomonas]
MNKSKCIRLSLRLWGEKINHELITNTLGLKPSHFYERGYVKKLSSGKTTTPKDLGIWVYERNIESAFEHELDSLLCSLAGKSLKSIEGVQIAILDIYLGLSDENSSLSDSYECRIHNSSLLRLGDLGVDVRITVS